MQTLPADIRTEDVSQWLDGGWVMAKGKAGNRPMRYRGTADGRKVYLREYDVDEGENADRRYSYKNVSIHWPLCGSINLHSARIALYVQRQQARQWRRTYNSRSLTLKVPGKWAIMNRAGLDAIPDRLTPDTPEVAKTCFEPTYPNVDTALDMLLNQDWYSVAISPHIILVSNGAEKDVYHRGTKVATINNDTLVPVEGRDGANRINKLLEGRFIT